MIDLSVTENLCVHNVGLTPGLWCGACNTHPEHPDRAALPPPARGGDDNPMIGGPTPLPPAVLPDEETP